MNLCKNILHSIFDTDKEMSEYFINVGEKQNHLWPHVKFNQTLSSSSTCVRTCVYRGPQVVPVVHVRTYVPSYYCVTLIPVSSAHPLAPMSNQVGDQNAHPLIQSK